MNTELIRALIDYGVIGVLVLMSFITIWLYIERLLFFKNIDLNKYKKKQELEIDLTKNISIISSFGANAPYIGLFGTVLSIIITFYTMGQMDNIDAKMIMSSLALALKATAMGLVVAIPAMMFYNHLARKIEVLIAKWEIMH